MSREEFFLLQARQLNALIRQDKNYTEHQEFLLAQVAASVINHGFSPPKNPVKIKDLMPSHMGKTARPRYQSRERVAANLGQILGGFMGR